MGIKQRLLILALLPFVFVGCGTKKNFEISDLDTATVTEKVQRTDIAESIPGYGLVINGAGQPFEFEVNINAQDSSKVQRGQKAWVHLLPDSPALACKVSRIVTDVSLETGQAIAWLESTHVPASLLSIPRGEFVSALITTRVRNGVITVPRSAIFIREAKTWVIRLEKDAAGKSLYNPVPVETGLFSDTRVEIKSGLVQGDEIMAQRGIGFLYPDFKISAGE